MTRFAELSDEKQLPDVEDGLADWGDEPEDDDSYDEESGESCIFTRYSYTFVEGFRSQYGQVRAQAELAETSCHLLGECCNHIRCGQFPHSKIGEMDWKDQRRCKGLVGLQWSFPCRDVYL